MSYKSKSYQKFLGTSISAAVVASAIAPGMAPAVQAAETSFSDVKSDDYFYAAVKDLSGRNIIQGYEDGSFRPYQTVTRAQAAKMLAMTLGLKTSNVKNPGFTDVKTTDWYYGPVAALVNEGIIKGHDDKTFRPYETLTRAQMAKMIALGFNLGETSVNKFSDVKKEDWFAGYVGSLIEKDITTGTTPTTFSPNKNITRGQMAAFIYRTEQAKKVYKIDSVTDSTVMVNGVSYKLDNHVKSVLNAANADVLKNGVIQFEEKDSVITKITSLEIKEGGEALKDQPVFDGKNGYIDGDLKISADYVLVQNITVKGNLGLGSNVKNNFYGNNVKVEGKTIVASEEVKQSANASEGNGSKSLAYKQKEVAAAEESTIDITFESSSIGALEVRKENTAVTVKGNTTIQEIHVYTDAVIGGDSKASIKKLIIEKGAKTVQLDIAVEEVRFKDNQEVTLSGKGNIGNLVIENKDAQINLGKDTQISNIALPSGTKVEDVIKNYEDVKSNISKVDGEPTTISSSGGGRSSSGGGSSTDNKAPQVTVTTSTVNIGEDVTAQSTEKGVMYLVLDDANITTKAAAEAAVTAGEAKTTIVSTANTNVTINTTGLSAGTYKVVASDEAGNLSSESSGTITLIDGAGGTNPDPDPINNVKFNKLTLSNDIVTKGAEEDIVIRIQTENPDKKEILVELWQNEQKVIPLLDDGQVENGDDISKDGVYSVKLDTSDLNLPIGENSFKVLATDAGNKVAESEFVLTVIEPYSDQQAAAISTLSSGVVDKANELIGESKETIAQGIKDLDSSIIEAAPSDSNGVWYASETGTLGGVIVSEENTGEQVSFVQKKTYTAQSAFVQKKTYAAQYLVNSSAEPEYIGNNQVLMISTGEAGPVMTDIKNELKSKFNVKTVSGSVQELKQVSKYGMVVLNTQGTSLFGKNLKEQEALSNLDSEFAEDKEKVVLLTSEKVTAEKTKLYQADLKKGRLVIVNDYYAITPSFAKKYWQDMSDTLFINASTYSAVNDSLSKVLLKNGAKTYVGFKSNNVSLDSVKTFVDKLIAGNTTGEAFSSLADDSLSLSGSSNVSLFLKGLVNGNFETGDISGWYGHGDVRVISKLGEDSTDLKALIPVEGNNMAIISTGLGSLDDDSNSWIERTFEIPEGMTALKFDYNVVSEEPMEWVGSQYDDRFKATLTAANGEWVLGNESVNTSDWVERVNIDLPEGDMTTYSTGWKRVTFDVSELQGQTVTLKFHTWDEGDSIFDTGVLLDHVRFTNSTYQSLEINTPDELSAGQHHLKAVLKDQDGDIWTSNKEVEWSLESSVEGVELTAEGQITISDAVEGGTKIKILATSGGLEAAKEIIIQEKSLLQEEQIHIDYEAEAAKVTVSNLTQGEIIKVYSSPNSKVPMYEFVSEGESLEFNLPYEMESVFLTSTQTDEVESDRLPVYIGYKDDNDEQIYFSFTEPENPVLINEEFTFALNAFSLAEEFNSENSKLRYKVEVSKDDNDGNFLPVSQLTIKYNEPGQSDFSSSFTTGEEGVAYFGPEDGLPEAVIEALKSEMGIETPFKATVTQPGFYEVKVTLVDVSGVEEISLGHTYLGFIIDEPMTGDNTGEAGNGEDESANNPDEAEPASTPDGTEMNTDEQIEESTPNETQVGEEAAQ